MKKQNAIPAILVGLCLGLSATTLAQSGERPISPVEKGSVIFNVGVGVGTEYQNDNSSAFGTKAAIEVGMWRAGPGIITIGAQAGGSFSNRSFTNNNYSDYKSNTFVVAARSAWHHGWNISGLDTYGGLSGGAGFHRYNYLNKDGFRITQNEVIPVVGVFIGASYFFTPTFGVNIEAGHDITQVQGGIVLKIK